MVTISLCMIVRNEEQNLGSCLESVKDIFDEIIMVDTGSNDRTKEIANCYGAKIYDFEWKDDFSAARNYSFSKANMEYIFWLDADDVLLDEDANALKLLKMKMDTTIDIVRMKYDLCDKDVSRPIITSYRERLLKRENNYTWKDKVYEYPTLSGGAKVSTDICVTHKNLYGNISRNLKLFEKMIISGDEFTVRNLFYYARTLYLSGRYEEAEIYYDKFMNTNDSFLSEYILACIDLADCYYKKNKSEEALKTLIRGFEYGGPHAEICCKIGSYYKNKENYINAVNWFDTATKIKKPEESLGLVIHDYWYYIPYMELSECYFILGNTSEALKYRKRAAEYKALDLTTNSN